MSRGKRLKEAREAKGYSQRDMAKELAITPPSYNYYEKNDAATFSTDLILLLSKLNINLNWIFTGDGEMLLTDTPEPTREEGDLAGELEERIRRIKIDVSDIEDTVRRWMQKKR
jgi:transcriptional regulator with XRE-family HTH domain